MKASAESVSSAASQSDEVSIHVKGGGCFTGYMSEVCSAGVWVENYDLENQLVAFDQIASIRNRDRQETTKFEEA